MRFVKVPDEPDQVDREGWRTADLEDVGGLLDVIDEELRVHGLQLVIGERRDDNWWVKVEAFMRPTGGAEGP